MEFLASTIKAEDLFSQSSPAGFVGRLFNFPLSRVIVILLFFAPIVIANSVVVLQVIENLEEPMATWADMVRLLLTIPLIILSYRFYCQIVEKRDAVEISYPGAFRQWGAGATMAAGLVLAFVFMIALMGEFTIVEFRSPLKLVNNFLVFSTGALLQDRQTDGFSLTWRPRPPSAAVSWMRWTSPHPNNCTGWAGRRWLS